MNQDKDPRFLSRMLQSILIIIVIVAIGLGAYNFILRKEFGELHAAAYVYDAEELAEMARKRNPDVIVVLNEEEGLWDKNGEGKIEMIPELIIEEEEGDTNKIFHRLGAVIADSRGNIYAVDFPMSQIKKFDRDGNFLMNIGRKGAGPGEFLTILSLTLGTQGNLFVYDYGTQRLNKFSIDGIWIDSITMEVTRPGSGPIRDSTGYYYFCYYDEKNDKVIHKYDSTGMNLTSFGEPIPFKQPMLPKDRAVKWNISGGNMTLFDNEIYFTRTNPYEIQKFTTNGDLLMRIYRKNDFMLPSITEIAEGGKRLGWSIPVASTMIAVWRDKIINWVWVPPHLASGIGGVLDLYNLEGQLLASLSFTDHIFFSSIDEQGKLYGVVRNSDDLEKIVRYSLKIKERR